MKKQVIFFGLIVSVFGNLKTAAQVNLQTGAAEFSLPLYSYTDANNRISTGVSLTYTAGNGLKASDIPSCVGTGWALESGGYIQRIQHGEPDDQKQEGTYPYPNQYSSPPINLSDYLNYIDNYYPNGYMYSEFDPTIPVDDGGGYTPLFDGIFTEYKRKPIYLTDREQDEFTFSFNGRKGSFLIGKNGTIKTIIDSKLKISIITANMLGSNIITRISEIHIIDELGIEYIFKDLELSEVMAYKRQYDAIDINNLQIVYPGTTSPSTSSNIYRGEAKNKFVVNKWYLSEIKNPLTNKKIIFEYESYNVDMLGNKSSFVSLAGNKADISLTLERIKGVSKRIKKIKSSDKEEVAFSYSSSNRKDLTFDKALEQISITYENETKSSWIFTYGYFIIDQLKDFAATLTEGEKYQSRLCLKSIQRTGKSLSDKDPPYLFSYYQGDYFYLDNGVSSFDYLRVSPVCNFFQDHWGYANTPLGSANVYLRDRRSDINYSNVDWSYAAGYSGNTYYSRNIRGLDFMGGILKTVKYPLSGTLTFEYEPNAATIPVTNQQIRVGGGRVFRTTFYDDNDHAKDIIKEYKYIREDQLSSGWGYEAPNYITTQMQTVFNCGNQIKPGVIVSQFASALPTMMKQSLVQWGKFGTVDQAFGLRRQAFNDLVVNIIVYILTAVFTSDYIDYNTTEYSYYSNTFSNPLPYQYSRVEVINKLSTDNTGKTVFQFSSDQDYPIDVPTLAIAGSMRPRYAPWAYGLPKSITTFDKFGSPVKKEENMYDVIKIISSDNNFAEQKWVPNKLSYACELNPGSNWFSQNINHDNYWPFFGRIELRQSKYYIYKTATDFALTTTDYEYWPANYLPSRTKTYNSKNELIETTVYYPENYTLGGTIQSMKNANIIATPICSQTIITKNGAQKYLIDGVLTEYGPSPNGDIKTVKSYSFRNDQPLLSSLAPFNPAQLNPNATYFQEIGSLLYNISGAAVQVNSDNGKLSTIYDYDNKLPVASVVNADVGEVAYSSFESDGTGGWTITPGSTIITTDGVTGKKSFSGTLTKNSLPLGNYTVTLWSLSGGTVTVNGQPGTALITNGIWRLYEWKLTNVTSAQIAADHIDEVRLYPSKARMNTSTYEPMIGKTSECDAANRITYYEYDALGRLSLVRDQYRNVIKKICYHASGEPENCPVIFNSQYFGGYVFRDNCPPNQLATPISVQFPYGQFTSVISQADADAQAAAYAQELANQQGRCIPPIYGRLEISPSQGQVVYPDENGDYNQFVDVWIKFYSDPAYTQPLTLTSNLNFTVIASNCIFYPDHFEIGAVGIPGTALAGTDGYLVSDLVSIWGAWNVYEAGVLTYFETWMQHFDIDLVSSDCGAIGNLYIGLNPPGGY
jgi:hypothetical protein